MPPIIIPYIPEKITVHTGPATQWAENVTVSFPDYIKNVASSEIYPTWDEDALRANILAQISFALNRVYTEYYRSRGYDFDITGSTQNDQKFIKGRSTFENVDRIVDELFTTYIRRKNTTEPLSARFCNGTTVTCDGLSQWGSEDLARQGYSYLEILRRYYGNDIELVSNTPIRNITNSYPGTPLRKGSSSESVSVLQVMLNRVADDYPAIPRIPSITGNFGDKTVAAVRKFQQVFSLAVDGVVGESTWYKLVLLYVGLNNLSELNSQGQRYYQIKPPENQTLSEGDRGSEVSALQYFLTVLAQVNFSVPAPVIDGVFGSETREAVIAAQRSLGLSPTGIVDSSTWQALYDEYISTAAALRPNVSLPTSPTEIDAAYRSGQFPGKNLSFGNYDE